ncbi:MAG: hypothetical protein RIQ93_2415, partial [Verrucomicrobiota bacterium]
MSVWVLTLREKPDDPPAAIIAGGAGQANPVQSGNFHGDNDNPR